MTFSGVARGLPTHLRPTMSRGKGKLFPWAWDLSTLPLTYTIPEVTQTTAVPGQHESSWMEGMLTFTPKVHTCSDWHLHGCTLSAPIAPNGHRQPFPKMVSLPSFPKQLLLLCLFHLLNFLLKSKNPDENSPLDRKGCNHSLPKLRK